MGNENKLTIHLRKGLQQALAYARYKERGLQSNPFNIDFVGDIWKIKVGRDDELINGIENLKEMADGNTKLLNILGSHGLGKSTFALLLYDLANQYNDELGFERIHFIKNDSVFKKELVESSFMEGADGQLFRVPAPLMSELSKVKKKVLVFIDDADISFQEYPKIFSEVAHLPNIFVVCAWNTSAWERAKQRTDIKFNSAEIIVLSKLTELECQDMIKKRINQFKMTQRADTLFSPEIIKTISKVARGSPHRTIRTSKRLLSFMINKKLIKINVGEDFNKFLSQIEDITYEKLMRKISNLTETQRKIVSEMKNIVEADATAIGKMLGISRVGAMNHLKHLKKLGILISTKKNRKMIYQLKEEIEYGTED